MLRLIVNTVGPLAVVCLSVYFLACSVAEDRLACERLKQAEAIRQQTDNRIEELKRFL